MLDYFNILVQCLYCVLPPQEFGFTDLDQVVFEDDLCLDVASHGVKAEVQLQMCHFLRGNQEWKYDNQVSSIPDPHSIDLTIILLSSNDILLLYIAH